MAAKADGAARSRRVAEGVEALSRWLRDVARDGWGARSDDIEALEETARRLVDAQAPGLARRVRALWEVRSDPEGLARALGDLRLLLAAYARLDTLSPGLAADVRARVGFTVRKQAVLAEGERVSDRWWVLGARTEQEEELLARRTWLLGQVSGRPALLLDFAPPRRPLPPGPAPGESFAGALAYYPSAAPLRVVPVPEEEPSDGAASAAARPPPPDPALLGGWLLDLDAVYAARRARLAACPWADRWAVGVRGLSPARLEEGAWALVDPGGRGLRLEAGDSVALALLAAGGGGPVGVFGAMEAGELRPLAIWSDGQLQPLVGEALGS